MKPARNFWLGVTLGVLAGVVAGVVGGAIITTNRFQAIVSRQYIAYAMDQTRIAARLRDGMQSQVLHDIDVNLPTYALTINGAYNHDRMAARSLRYVKFYYDRHSLPIPTQIEPILVTIPTEETR